MGWTLDMTPICLSLEGIAVHADYKVLVNIDDNSSQIDGDL